MSDKYKITEMTKNIVLIGNPIAGGGALKKIKKAVNILKNRGYDVNLMLTAKKGDAEAFAKQISSESPLPPFSKGGEGGILVIAAGGDGTYNEVANGLVYSNIPMAILPMGTTSVLAKELKIPKNINKAIDTALNGKITKVHLGRITYTENRSQESEIRNRHFFLMAGIGFDGEAVYGVNKKIKKYTGKGAYILSGIKALIKYNPLPITLINKEPETNGQKITTYAAIIGKAARYGGNFKITPNASLTEPFFYVFAIHKKGRLNMLKYMSAIATCCHLRLKDISYFKTSKIRIEGNAHIQIDGDYVGKTPTEINISKDALMLIVPN